MGSQSPLQWAVLPPHPRLVLRDASWSCQGMAGGWRLPALPHRWAEAGLPSKQSVAGAGIRRLRAGIVSPGPEEVDTWQD